MILGFYAGITLLTLWGVDASALPFFFASLTACLGAGIVGLIDDVLNLRKRTKAVLPFVLALPLGAVVEGTGNTVLFGIDIGLFMVFAVALGVTSAANVANMLEGFNGLGAGLMVIVASTLIALSFIYGAHEGVFLLFPLLGALLAFLWFNRYPARVFPGDSMTLFAGATLASAAIISSPSLKALGTVLFLPMIVEFILKARGRFRAENYGEVDTDGRLRWNGRVESIAHLVMRNRRLTEWQVVAAIWAIEGALCFAVVAGVLLTR